jgi:hypothetical protein
LSKAHRLAVVAIAVVAGAFLFAAAASASCNPNRSGSCCDSLYDGWQRQPPTGVCYTGIIGSIFRYPHPYIAVGGASSAWVMIQNGSTGYYAQVGWHVTPGGVFSDFTQSLTSHGGFQGRSATYNGNSSPTFRLEKSASQITYWRDGLLFDSHNVPGGFGGCLSDALTEVFSLQNQEPGGSQAHEQFRSAQVRRSDTNGYSYMNGNTYNSEGLTWGNQQVSSSGFDVWDTYCLL